ncbi:MAG: hypothetical protein ACPG6P_05825 [Akkermansiaceae bacterium]
MKPIKRRIIVLISCTLPVFTHQADAAIDWTTWNRSSADIKLIDSHIAPDGRLRILFVEDVSFSSTERLVKLATVDEGSFQVETIEKVGNATESSIEHHVRLVGNNERVWAVWRKKIGSGAATIRAAQIYPRSGPLTLEVVDNNNSFNRYDAAIGSDGLPRVVFIESAGFRLGMVRRHAAGAWSTTYNAAPTLTHLGDFIYRELSLASHGNKLGLAYVLNERGGSSGTSAPYNSKLIYRSATEPANWSTLTFGTAEVVAEANFNPELPIANGIELAITESGHPAMSFPNLSNSSGTMAVRSAAGVWSSHVFVSAFSAPRGTNLALSPDGNIHVSWQSTINHVHHRVWNGSSFGPSNEVTGVTSFSPDLEINSDNLPLIVSRSTDGSLLQVTLPTDITDEDRDGVTYLAEIAFGMDPQLPDLEDLPSIEAKSFGGQDYITVVYLGRSGGTGINPYITADFEYHTEVSEDLITWSSSSSDVVQESRFTIAGKGTVNTHRSTAVLGSKGKLFLRVRVVRR